MNKARINQIALDFKWRKQVAMIAGFFWKQRAKRVAKYILPYFSEGERIIDIGAGSGMIPQVISQYIRADFTLVDVIDWNITNFPLVLFDGKHIPLADKKFDTALLIDVLHHSEEEEQVIKEALRVSKRVIIIEEVYEHAAMNFLANISDNFQWFLYGMPIGVHHRSKEKWLEFLRKCSFRDVACVKEYWNHAIFAIDSSV